MSIRYQLRVRRAANVGRDHRNREIVQKDFYACSNSATTKMMSSAASFERHFIEVSIA